MGDGRRSDKDRAIGLQDEKEREKRRIDLDTEPLAFLTFQS